MNTKQRKTLEAIFETPTRADVRWAEVESLLKALGGVIAPGKGSRVRIMLSNRVATFHRPHPRPVAKMGLVEALRDFLASMETYP
jgi:hypothetical protein